MPQVTSFNYKEEPGADRTTWTTNADGNGDLSWFVRQRGLNRDDGPYSPFRHLGTDGNIWKVWLHSERVFAQGPGGNRVPYVICKFESHREDDQGTNNENWIAIVDWDGSHWKVEPKYDNAVGQPVAFNLTRI